MIKEHELILSGLKQYLETYPTVRFLQALNNLGIVRTVTVEGTNYWKDDYYVEDEEIVKKVFNKETWPSG